LPESYLISRSARKKETTYKAAHAIINEIPHTEIFNTNSMFPGSLRAGWTKEKPPLDTHRA